MANEWGDFQTPPPLVKQILDCLGQRGQAWQRALEPTCGRGNFLWGLAAHPAFSDIREIHGIEVQEQHSNFAHKQATAYPHIHLHTVDFFQFDLQKDLQWQTSGPLLVIGNPPWVTSASLGQLHSQNLPPKQNLKKLKGLDAQTGKSNFDLAEAILLKLIRELEELQPSIAVLCKLSTARQILEQNLNLESAWIRQIDANAWFGAKVEAGLFYLQLGKSPKALQIPIYETLASEEPQWWWQVEGKRLIRDYHRYQTLKYIEGPCQYAWRQGVKHDAARVLELTYQAGVWQNKLGQAVETEEAYAYPLLKSTDVYHQLPVASHRRLLLPQQALGQDTHSLASLAPKFWAYLRSHKEIFEERKSSIYQQAMPFAIFGIGPYSFAPYKIAISGLHSQIRFCLVAPYQNKVVLFDDTTYFLPFEQAEEAALAYALLSHPDCIAYLESASFPDAKRPITKKLLANISLEALKSNLNPNSYWEVFQQALLHLGHEKAGNNQNLPYFSALFQNLLL